MLRVGGTKLSTATDGGLADFAQSGALLGFPGWRTFVKASESRQVTESLRLCLLVL